MVPSDALLSSLGLYPAIVRRVTLLHRRHDHALYRIECAQRSYILKLFRGPGTASEVQAYDLLERLDVPTLPVLARTRNALVLEDLEGSEAWRLASEDDVQRAETGAALAAWYHTLHAAGRRLLTGPHPDMPSFLRRETDALTPLRVLEIGKALRVGTDALWRLAAAKLDALKAAERELPATLTYNDFHWSNLALSRSEAQPEAIVFDYHLLGIGMAHSDVRNVTGGLGSDAQAAFLRGYGPTNEQEAVLDAPLATLQALDVALQRPTLPAWATPLLGEIEDGTFEANLRHALSTLR